MIRWLYKAFYLPKSLWHCLFSSEGGWREGRRGKKRKLVSFCVISDPIMQINKCFSFRICVIKDISNLSCSPEIELLTPPKVKKTFFLLPKTLGGKGRLVWEWFPWTLHQTHAQPSDHNLGASLCTFSLQTNRRGGPQAHKNSARLTHIFFFLKFSVFMGLQDRKSVV